MNGEKSLSIAEKIKAGLKPAF
ncbi:hypothetical protein V12G01_20758 [Vibrio alginolyticus 12G01]|nr:hypothetical protein V12G01_20758 [Vibrio alginolyticus 12G01]